MRGRRSGENMTTGPDDDRMRAETEYGCAGSHCERITAMSNDWFREQARLDQMRQDQQFQDQLVQNQFLDAQRISAQRDVQRIDAQHGERRRDWEDETRQRQNGDLEQLIAGIDTGSGEAHVGTSRPNVGVAGGPQPLTWGRLIAAGLAVGAVWLAQRYEQQQAQRPPDPTR
jgi:hypothetical protein